MKLGTGKLEETLYLFNVTAHAVAHTHLIAKHTVDKKPVCIQSETFNHYIM